MHLRRHRQHVRVMIGMELPTPQVGTYRDTSTNIAGCDSVSLNIND